MKEINKLIKKLPDQESAVRFWTQLGNKFPLEQKKLLKNEALLSDVLALVSFSPLLATTFLQHKSYFSWLGRQKFSAKVRGKDELLESLARFALTNSTLEPNVLLTRFRRRELLRIYLQDIRNLETVAEITEEISNLADAVLEYALRLARQELDNRYGHPLETDEKGRARQAEFCVVALGKLGSKELNYSSDIDLLFLYSSEGQTSGSGTRGTVTNREYFVKLAEFIIKLVGQQTGEGAAYRVDMRLRPHGRVGALAISKAEAVKYFQTSAQAWERQVLIRSRAAAGDAEVFQDFFRCVEPFVFSKTETVANALRNVRLSKERIDLERISTNGFDVKLGIGGIREIEFIAQALQIAHGGTDEWLRVSHTLISLTRLTDRKLLSENDLAELSEAYHFLRRLEHRLQMENGLQTHLVPNDPTKRLFIAKLMSFQELDEFDSFLKTVSGNVNRIFKRVFTDAPFVESSAEPQTEFRAFQVEPVADPNEISNDSGITLGDILLNSESRNLLENIVASLNKTENPIEPSPEIFSVITKICRVSPHFADFLASNPLLIYDLPNPLNNFEAPDYRNILLKAVQSEKTFAARLAVLRKLWSKFLLEIAVFDIFEKITLGEAKNFQTCLAEASLETAYFVTQKEIERQYSIKFEDFPLAVLALGKLGGKGVDYGSDLDLVLIYDLPEKKPAAKKRGKNAALAKEIPDVSVPDLPVSVPVLFARAVEIFVTVLSAMTREGSLYRIDLRLRPDGKNGATSLAKSTFLNYLQKRSAIWELLAYVKIRGVSGRIELADEVAQKARRTIHQKASKIDSNELHKETRDIREKLRLQKTSRRPTKEIDIKYGEGGMLDVYFAMRFLQLRDNVPDDLENRSTDFMLRKLFENGSLSSENFENFSKSYRFLSELDHQIRLTVGRSTLLPTANKNAMRIISERLKFNSINEMLENLALHRINIRYSFENILK